MYMGYVSGGFALAYTVSAGYLSVLASLTGECILPVAYLEKAAKSALQSRAHHAPSV
jgi:hypothetical protein